MLRVTGTAISHPGQVRKTNQDRAFYDDAIGAVADGMGGHQGGEQAAAITIEIMSRIGTDPSRQRLLDTVRLANRAVFDESERPELRGMGTTIVAAALHPDDGTVTMINVGDSRGYRFRAGRLQQVTVDHSLVEELVRQGRISEEDARSHPQRNIVTRALGLSTDIDIDVFDLDAQHGDRLLLCSDGLFNEVAIDVIAERLGSVADLDALAAELVDLACEGGGRDNISVVLLDITDDEDPGAIRASVENRRRKDPMATRLGSTIREDDVPSDRAATVIDDVPDAPGFEPDPVPTEEVPPIDQFEDSFEPAAAAPPVEPVHAAPMEPQVDPVVERDRGRSRWVALAVIATFLLAFLGINWYAGGAYFATEQSGEVVILKGRPGGLLWIDPELEETTGVSIGELAPAGVQQLEQEVEWTSLDDARTFVDQLERVDAPADGATDDGG